jgi:DNA-directed RNA polymerase specialized sigma24 family protein
MTTKRIKELGVTWEERFWQSAVLRSELTGHHVIVSVSNVAQASEFAAQLPVRTREMLQMRFEGETIPDIARRFHLSDGRVDKIVRKATLGLMWFLYHAN